MGTVLATGIISARAEPAVANVIFQQRSDSGLVDIWYDLLDQAAIITLSIETNGVALPNSRVTRLTGDVSTVIQPSTGLHIVWDAAKDWPENRETAVSARITAWTSDDPPPYMVVDLTRGKSGTAFPVTYYPEDGLPYGGVTNELYKTVLLVLRRVPAGSFTMGSPATEVGHSYMPFREVAHRVTLTKDFYIGIYEVTQTQWYQVMNGNMPAYYNGPACRDMRPVENRSYFLIRESHENGLAVSPNWPSSYDVGTNSFMGRLSAYTGSLDFDLPTDAQWEYACRAGTANALNILGGIDITNMLSDASLAQAGRYKYNGGYVWNSGVLTNAEVVFGVANVPDAYATAKVGCYLPNAWGLYDMHGNVYEWVLDWILPNDKNLGTDPVTDPAGYDNAGSDTPGRVVRGGHYGADAWVCRSALRTFAAPTSAASSIGFRVVRRLGR
jgi:formylglycine-generating enzyme required for sulfatase activity